MEMRIYISSKPKFYKSSFIEMFSVYKFVYII